MRRYMILFIVFAFALMLGGCKKYPELSSIEIEEAIKEHDLFFSYVDTEVGDITIERELTETNKTVWISTDTELDNLIYKGAYKLTCNLYDTPSGEQWFVDEIEILYDHIRLIPTLYNYEGTWIASEGGDCFSVDEIDWENARIKCDDDGNSRALEAYMYEEAGKLFFGMKTKSDALKFQMICQERVPDWTDPRIFDTYHFETKCMHVSSETRMLGFTYSLVDNEIMDERMNSHILKDCIVLKSKDGLDIATGEQVMDCGQTSTISVERGFAVQIDFMYGLEDVFYPYVGEEIIVCSYGKEIATVVIEEEDVLPFVSFIVGDSDTVSAEEVYHMDQAFEIYSRMR